MLRRASFSGVAYSRLPEFSGTRNAQREYWSGLVGIAGQGMDVRPHPHIGLATVTYLFDGRVMHRDSDGNALEITPGAMNLMTAGRGIAERSPLSARRGTEGIFGIQSWIALPQAHVETVSNVSTYETDWAG